MYSKMPTEKYLGGLGGQLLWEGETYVNINNPGHMTKIDAMPIYGKNPSKIFSGTGGLISMKLGMGHQWL